jgi:predicted oxidoreductase
MITIMHDSSIIAGCMKWGAWGAGFSAKEYDRMVRECMDAGVHTFDHADIYGGYTTEAEFGSVLRNAPSLRDEMRLITKCGICLKVPERPAHEVKHYDTRASHIVASAERSLRNLQTDRIDLLLIHRPDPLMDPEEIAEALDRLMKEGKVLSAGISNFSVSQTDLISRWIPITTHQLEFSLGHPDPLFNGVLDRCRWHNIRVQAWSPLGGLFSANGLDGEQAGLRMATEMAKRRGVAVDQILLAWILHHPMGIRPVIGTTRPERVRAAVAAAENIELSRQEWFQLLEAYRGQEVP